MVDLINVVLGWIHLLGVIIWIGGAVFFDAILQPGMRSLSPDQAARLGQAVTKRFMPIVWGAIIILIVTGLLRAAYIGVLNPVILFGTGYGEVLVAKMILVLATLVIGLIITKIGLGLSKPPSQEYVIKAQKRIKMLSEANIVLGIAIVLLAVVLRYT